MAITIKDVAKDTNLSLATISKYLNGKNISEKNQKIIEKSVQKLGYAPSKTAQLLRAHKSNTICILSPSIGDYYWTSIFRHIEEYFRSLGCPTIIISYDSYSHSEQGTLNLLKSNHVSGVILIPFMENVNNIHYLLQENNIPFVCLDQQLSDFETDVVTSTNFQSAYDATLYLIKHGHQRLCVLSGEEHSYTSKERFRGFNEACDYGNIAHNNRSHVFDLCSNPSNAKDFCQRLKQESPPTAILSLRYDIAITFLSHLNDTSLSIPADVSLITFDDDLIFSAYKPPITVIAQSHKKLSEKAAQLLYERINGNTSLPIQSIHIPTTMIERKSVSTLTSLL